jgi:hypothetical protein
MKIGSFWGVLALTLAVASPGLAGGHRANHCIDRFVEAWNAHDAATMAKRWTADATAVDVLGRSANGRAAVAQLFTQGTSTLKLTSAVKFVEVGEGAGVEEREVGLAGVVQFEGEISGMRSTSGTLLPAFVRRFTAKLVWAPDLPGGDHPAGRYFIASIRTETPAR